MKQLFLPFLLVFSLSVSLFSQVNFTANDQVVPYTGKFRPGINQGFYPNWNNQTLADISMGNPAVGQKGVGARSIRQGLYEIVLDFYGYGLNHPDFAHFNSLGGGEHVAIVGGPSGAHQDYTQHCPGKFSNMFANLYTPTWDGGANGTPYNDQNYFAAYVYKLVSQYKDQVRFWEIWNEPGLDLTGNLGWRDQNFPGNWWAEGPNPCDNILHAPIYHYIRTLRIAWDVIKTVDPDGYVCLGSVGYQSFMNALLSNTDNPNNGDVSPEFPLKGGAYFDAITYHSYPHFDGSTTNFDLNFFERHSDEAADGVVKYRQYYQQILDIYGYNGTTYPRKEWIMTETNSPRKVFGEAFPGSGKGPFFGGVDAQINHMMKAFMVAKVNKVHQMHTFQLLDQRNESDANYEFHLMGLYKNLNGAGPYNVQVNDVGKALKTVTDLVFDTELDPVQTAAMNLPASVRGYAFKRPNGSYVYALWARTTEDLSEAASATYSFPASFGISNLTKYAWDYGYTNATQTISGQNILLDGRPVFFTTGAAPTCLIVAAVSNIQCNDNGTPNNPADDTFTFTLTVTGNNTSAMWRSFIVNKTYTGSYGVPQTIGPFPISGGTVFFGVSDATITPCATEVFALPPAPCSTGGGGGGNPCTSKSDFPWHDWIAGVQIGSINNPSGKTNYSDFTAQTTNLAAGASHPVSLTAGFSWFTFNEFWRIWIDFNKNGTFEASEKVFEGTQTAPAAGTPTSVFNGSLSIPAGAATGSARMRISMKRGAFPDPCEVLPFGEVEDYTINVGTGGGGGNCAINALVSNVLCNVNGTPNNPADDTYTFDLTVTGTNTGSGWTANVGGQPTSGNYGTPKTFGPYAISSGGKSISVSDNANATCTTTANATAPAPCSTGGPSGNPCSSKSDFPWHDWIGRVQIGSINNPSGKSAYSDFTNTTTVLQRGSSASITLTANYSWNTFDEYWKVWIDYNKNGTFEEPSEIAFQGIQNKPANGTTSVNLTGNITVPGNAPTGPTRMRISMKRDAYALPCETLPFGEVEDYSVEITPNLQSKNAVSGAEIWDTDRVIFRQTEEQKFETSDFQIYPNPARNRALLDLRNLADAPAKLFIFNALGMKVSLVEIPAGAPRIFEISLENLPGGQYFLQLQAEGKAPAVRKLVVEN